MRVMVLIKATEQSEAGEMPSQELLTAMTAFNEELVKAGVMLGGDGLHPSSRGARVIFSGSERKRIPDPMPGSEAVVEIRPVFEAEDFGEELTPELRAREDELRQQLDADR